MFDHDDYCYIFAMQTTEAWLRARGRVCRTYFWESVYSTLFLGRLKLRKLQRIRQDCSSGRCLVDMNDAIPMAEMV
mgnify:FL=1